MSKQDTQAAETAAVDSATDTGADRLSVLEGLINEAPPESTQKELGPAEDDKTEESESDETVTPGESTDNPEEKVAAEKADHQDEETEDEVSEDEEQIEGITPELQKRIAKRIGKEVSKRKREADRADAAEAKIAELTQQLSAKPADEPVRSAKAGPLDAVDSVEKLRKVIGEARDAKEFAETELDSLDVDPEGTVERLQAAGFKLEGENLVLAAKLTLKKIRRNAESTLDPLTVGDVQQRIEHRLAWDRETEAHCEWIKDDKNPDTVTVKKILADEPLLRNRPNGKYLAAALMEGLRVIGLRQKAKAAKPAVGSSKPKPSPQPGGKTAAPAKKASSETNEESTRQASLKNPDDRETRVNALRGFL